MNILKINVLTLNLLKKQPTLYSFKTKNFYNPYYRTTLTNHKSIPPTIITYKPHLYIIKNKKNTKNLFLYNINNSQYKYFQIPKTKFISLTQITIKNNHYIFL